MKTWIKVVLGLIIIGVLSFATYIGMLVINIKMADIDNSVEYHTKEELSDLYWQNEELLNSVKNSVLSNKKVLQALIDEQDGDTGIYTKHDEVYFSQEEWVNIVSVFENLHPYMIGMERKGRPVKLYIDFAKLELDTGSKETTLYWFTDKKEIEYQKEHSLADSVAYTQIDGNWYIVEETFHW